MLLLDCIHDAGDRITNIGADKKINGIFLPKVTSNMESINIFLRIGAISLKCELHKMTAIII